MSELRIEVETAAGSMSELRPVIDAALHEQFPGGMLKRQWDGDVLRLTGPGAQGTVELVGGKLVGVAELKPPASLMRPVIEKKIGEALRKVAAGG